MNPRLIVLVSALLTCASPEARPADEGALQRRLPNIVIILADDLGYGDAGCYGATKIKTPAIDRVAGEGMRFTDAHSPSSVCTPSRYNLMTGRYAWRTWAGSGTVWSNDPLLIEPGRTTIASLLKDAGYRTGLVGKWHLGYGASGQLGWDELRGPDYNRDLVPGPLEVGFDSYFGFPHTGQLPHVYIRDRRVLGLEKVGQPIRLVLDPKPEFQKPYLERPRHIGRTPWHKFENTEPIQYQHEDLAIRITEEAVKWIEAQDGERPFFLTFTHRNPHTPWKPHPRFAGTSEAGVYGDFVQEFDWSVGEVLAALDRKGFAGDTLVIVTSDNGAGNYRPNVRRLEIDGHLANGEMRGQKTDVYEGGHRVPFVVRWPSVVPMGSTSDALVALTDLLATFAELTKQPLPNDAGEDSFSFLAALDGRPVALPARTALVHDSYRGAFAIREGDWKLITVQGSGGFGWTPESYDASEPPQQLFNLAEDPGEERNLIGAHPERALYLNALLHRYRAADRTAPLRN